MKKVQRPLNPEIVEIMLHHFRKRDVYRNTIQELEQDLDVPIEYRISYNSPMDIKNDVKITSPPSSGGQPERDTLMFKEKERRYLSSLSKLKALEDALSYALEASMENARLSNKRIYVALEEHLCYGTKISKLRPRVNRGTLNKYKYIAIVKAALALGYTEDEIYLK